MVIACYNVDMYIDTIPNRSSPPAVLLRTSRRVGKRIVKDTLANISHWPKDKIEALRAVLREEAVALHPEKEFAILRSLPHGHVQAVLGTIRKLGLDSVIASKRSRQRDLVVGMIAARILFPTSKLDTIQRWKECTLAAELGIGDADEDELYAVLDWLQGRKDSIEKKLAQRHLSEGSSVLYDLSSSYYYGHCCPLAVHGNDRDGKKGLPIIVYGVLANGQGCPVAVEVYAGNTSDPKTVPQQAQKMRERFGLRRVVLVGDRGCLTQTTIDALRAYPGLGWIGALRSEAIRALVDQKVIQPSLFDQHNLAEIHSCDYPDERLMACFNPLLAEERRRKRRALLEATQKQLDRIAALVCRRKRKPLKEGEIGVRVGKVVNRFKVAKHFDLDIADGHFCYTRQEDHIEREEQLDGLYVVRTSEPAERLSPEDTVRRYKSLSHMERTFRCLKGIDLMVRPIFLRLEEHVRGHVLLCVLAYHVEWHMRQSLAPLLYADEELPETRRTRDPVAPPEPSESAREKKSLHRTPDGLPVQTFPTLLKKLGTLCRNTCRLAKDPGSPSFDLHTEPTPLQQRAFQLLGLYPVEGT